MKRRLLEGVETLCAIQVGAGIANHSWVWWAIASALCVVSGVWASSVRDDVWRARIDRVLCGAHEYGYLGSELLHELDDRLKYNPEKRFTLRGVRS
jgi:hypothetical protein